MHTAVFMSLLTDWQNSFSVHTLKISLSLPLCFKKWGSDDDVTIFFLSILIDKCTFCQEVSRVLLGLNCGKPLESIHIPESAKELSLKQDFDLQVRPDEFFFLLQVM